MKIKKSKDVVLFNIIAYFMLSVLAIVCIVPFWMIIVASFTNNDYVIMHGYSLFPKEVSMAAYEYILKQPQEILQSYGVSIFVTLFGTALSIFCITMAGYVLNRKDFKYRSKISFYIYFTSLFSGGMVPSYILMTKILKLQNTNIALILPHLVTPFLIILMRNFMKSIPDALIEASKIDGANDFKIFTSVVLPLSGPGIATVGLFRALMYWNSWQSAMLYITKPNLYPLQYYLYRMLEGSKSLQEVGVDLATGPLPTESIKMAMVVIATGPIILLYPMVQKYFVAGITVGAVKE